ncbi:MAG: CRISPR system precrRNA processing endoribonuclease RAMP protein Cas6 [bacterium]|nr:CRISPR system precrRNA processing endoribonuclease RAMP protein Cas6 [bacterium]
MIQHLNRLADLAFYTGVGSKTTKGMGQVNRF